MVAFTRSVVMLDCEHNKQENNNNIETGSFLHSEGFQDVRGGSVSDGRTSPRVTEISRVCKLIYCLRMENRPSPTTHNHVEIVQGFYVMRVCDFGVLVGVDQCLGREKGAIMSMCWSMR